MNWYFEEALQFCTQQVPYDYCRSEVVSSCNIVGTASVRIILPPLEIAISVDREIRIFPYDIHKIVFSSAFLITLGPGVLILAIHKLNYQFRGSQIIGIITCLLTIILLILIATLYISKACIFPRNGAAETHPQYHRALLAR